MSKNKKQNENVFSLVDDVTPDLEGFLDTGEEPDCEEKIYSIQGTEVIDHGSAK